jgi:hypothetical protein
MRSSVTQRVAGQGGACAGGAKNEAEGVYFFYKKRPRPAEGAPARPRKAWKAKGQGAEGGPKTGGKVSILLYFFRDEKAWSELRPRSRLGTERLKAWAPRAARCPGLTTEDVHHGTESQGITAPGRRASA